MTLLFSFILYELQKVTIEAALINVKDILLLKCISNIQEASTDVTNGYVGIISNRCVSYYVITEKLV